MCYVLDMRTTLTIEDQIDLRLRTVAERQNRSYKDVVNEALAAGLQQLEVAEPLPEYQVKVQDFGFQAGVDIARLNQLYDELETES